MSTFDADGFLSEEITGFEHDIATRYAKKLDRAYKANRLTHRAIYSATIYNEVLIDLLLATLLARQAGSFQAFIVLLRRGFLTESQILLRSLAETMFIVGALRKDEGFAYVYVNSDEVARLKSIEALVRDQERRGVAVDPTTKDLSAELREKIKKEGITKAPSAEAIAHKAGLSSYYDTLYRFTSMAVHTSVRGLDRTLEVGPDGKAHSLTYEPITDDLEMYFDYGTSMMLYTLHEIASHFKLAIEDTRGRLLGPERLRWIHIRCTLPRQRHVCRLQSRAAPRGRATGSALRTGMLN